MVSAVATQPFNGSGSVLPATSGPMPPAEAPPPAAMSKVSPGVSRVALRTTGLKPIPYQTMVNTVGANNIVPFARPQPSGAGQSGARMDMGPAAALFMNLGKGLVDVGLQAVVVSEANAKPRVTGEVITPKAWNALSPRGQQWLMKEIESGSIKESLRKVPMPLNPFQPNDTESHRVVVQRALQLAQEISHESRNVVPQPTSGQRPAQSKPKPESNPFKDIPLSPLATPIGISQPRLSEPLPSHKPAEVHPQLWRQLTHEVRQSNQAQQQFSKAVGMMNELATKADVLINQIGVALPAARAGGGADARREVEGLLGQLKALEKQATGLVKSTNQNVIDLQNTGLHIESLVNKHPDLQAGVQRNYLDLTSRGKQAGFDRDELIKRQSEILTDKTRQLEGIVQDATKPQLLPSTAPKEVTVFPNYGPKPAPLKPKPDSFTRVATPIEVERDPPNPSTSPTGVRASASGSGEPTPADDRTRSSDWSAPSELSARDKHKELGKLTELGRHLNRRLGYPAQINIEGLQLVSPGLVRNMVKARDIDPDAELHLARADLRGKDLTDANLSGADCRETRLSLADLKGTNLERANLAGADLRNADLRNANLQDADLTNADLSGALLSGANLTGATLRGTEMQGVVGHEFTKR
jgi:hypothetical protein